MVIDETLESDDVGTAERYIAHVYERARFRESAEPFRFRQHVIGDDRVTFARFEISSPAELAVDFGDVLGIGTLSAGAYRAASNGTMVDVDAPFLLRPGLAQSWSSEFDLTMVNLDLTAFRRFVGPDRARFRIEFPSVAPVSSAHARKWARTSRMIGDTLADPELRTSELLTTSAVDLLFAAASVCFPLDVIASMASPGELMPKALHRAVSFIESSADQPIRLDDIAAASGLTVRGLHKAFQRSLGTTPYAYLRRVRLAELHNALLHAEDDATVSSLALRWGFTNRGRLAAEYRSVYGESPRDTLER